MVPLVTIITPTFNRSGFLRESINSVINQKYRPIEHIIIDDGSTEDIESIVKEFKTGKDFYLHYIRQENKGVSNARNTGIEATHGEYVVFLDSDDLLCEGMIHEGIEFLDSNSAIDMVCGGWKQIDNFGRDISGFCYPTNLQTKSDKDFLKTLLIKGRFPNHAIISRRSSIFNTGFMDNDLNAFEDWVYWIRMAMMGFKIKYLQSDFSLWRVHNLDRRSAIGEINKIKETIDSVVARIYSYPETKPYYPFKNNIKFQLWLEQACYFKSKDIKDVAEACARNALLLVEHDLNYDLEFFINHYASAIKLGDKDLLAKIKRYFPKSEFDQFMFNMKLKKNHDDNIGNKWRIRYGKALLFLNHPLLYVDHKRSVLLFS